MSYLEAFNNAMDEHNEEGAAAVVSILFGIACIIGQLDDLIDCFHGSSEAEEEE